MMYESNHVEELSLVNILKNIKYDFKQNLVISGSPPSLKHILLSNIATELWNEKLRNVDSILTPKYKKVWELLKVHENEIKDKVSQLEIPVDCIDSLKLVINSVGKEIEDYVQSYLDIYDRSNIDKLRVFLKSIRWTQQGTINYLKTTLHIINKSNLSIKDKYEIACNCCLEEKIRDLLKELPDDIVKEFEDDREPFSFPLFWTSYIRNGELPTLIKGALARKYLLRFAISGGYNLSIQYIWEKFANEAVKECLMMYMELAGKVYPNAVFYFAKQMTQFQLEEVSSIIHCWLLYKLHTISRYCDILSISHYIKELIRSKNVYHNCKVITFCWVQSLLKAEEFLNIWKEFVLRFKPDIESNIVDIYNNNISNFFGSMPRYIIVIKFLLGMTNPENRSEFICANNTNMYCVDLIKYLGLDQFNFFLKNLLETVEISWVKKNFFDVSSLILCNDLIAVNKYDVLDDALIELCAEENIKAFKKGLVYANISIFASILSNIVANEMDIILALNKYLSWCFDGDQKEMTICRETVFDIESNLYSDVRRIFYRQINALSRQRKWNLVEKYWQWFFYATNKNITTSKEKLKRIKKIILLISGHQHFFIYMENIDCHVVLKRFIISCFKQEEVEELKKELQRHNDLKSLVFELLQLVKLQESNDFLEWCYSSDKNKIESFKATFTELYGFFLMISFIKCNIEKINSLIGWLTTSEESANNFKENFVAYIANKKEIQLENNEIGEEHFDMENACITLNERFRHTIKLIKFYADKNKVTLVLVQLELLGNLYRYLELNAE